MLFNFPPFLKSTLGSFQSTGVNETEPSAFLTNLEGSANNVLIPVFLGTTTSCTLVLWKLLGT